MRRDDFLDKLYEYMKSEGIDDPEQHVSFENGDLTIQACKLYRLPDVFKEYARGIKSLSLIDLTMIEFPEVILQLTNLRTLRLIGTNVERVSSLRTLNKLEKLTISLCPMYVLGSLQYMPELKWLNISSTRLVRFPTLPTCNHIMELVISNTDILELPNELALPELEMLDISFTPIKCIPKHWLSVNMKTLNVGHSSIEQMPETLTCMHNLENLNITRTKIKELPSLTKMPNLMRLEISNTQMDSFPKGIPYQKLEYLGVCMCEFDELPERLVLGMLDKGMRFYDARGEWTVEDWNSDMKSTGRKVDQGIFIHGLILKKMDVRYLKQGENTRNFIKVYYQAEDRVPSHEVKIIVMGDSGSGKSMLVERSFELNKADENTEGLQIYQDSTLSLPGLPQDARLRVWEVHNTPQLELINPLFLTEECLYIVVLDSRDGQNIYQAARYWLGLIEKHAPYDHVLFVLTFCEQSHTRLFDPNLISEKDCLLKTNSDDVALVRMDEQFLEEDIQSLRERMTWTIKKMAAYHHEYPIAWKRAEHQLISLLEARSVISYGRFIGLCVFYGIVQGPDPRDAVMSSFLRWLRETGAVQYVIDSSDIRQDPYLTTNWLFDSVWFAEGVSKITSFASEKFGRVKRNELFDCLDDWQVLNNEQYTPENIQLLLRAMKNNGLCLDHGDRIFFPTMDSIFSDVKEETTKDWVNAVLADESHIHYRIDCAALSIDFLAKIISLILEDNVVHNGRAGYEGAIFGFVRKTGGGSLVMMCTFGVPGRIEIYASSQVKNPRLDECDNLNSQQRKLSYMKIAIEACKEIFRQYKASKCVISVEMKRGDDVAFLPLSEIEGCIKRKIPSYFLGSLERWFTVNPDLTKYVTYTKI